MDNSVTSAKLRNLPLVLALVLGAFLWCPRVQRSDHVYWSFVAVSGGLIAWFFALRLVAKLRNRPLEAVAIPPVKQHYIQASVQLVLYGYWGFLWVQDGVRPIYDQAPLVVAQFFFLYAFDALWSWTRGRPWRLASGPTPIVLSTNLFIWFRDDWFIWQFAMITMGLLGKEFIRWTKDGRRTHVFNPSGFGLACAATLLILTDSTDITWAKPLATTIEVEHIFLVIFVLGLVVQHFFAVTLMTFAAALVMIACNLGYTQLTGVYLFGSSNLPAAAFLGLHLLMTDPVDVAAQLRRTHAVRGRLRSRLRRHVRSAGPDRGARALRQALSGADPEHVGAGVRPGGACRLARSIERTVGARGVQAR